MHYYYIFILFTYSMDIKEELVKTLRVILKKIRINNLKLFYEIYGTLLIQIFDEKQSNRGM